MPQKNSSPGLRMLAVLLLAGAAVPLALAWRGAAGTPGRAGATNSADEAQWEVPNQLEVQLRPGTTDSDLADLSKKIGAALTWNSPEARDDTDVAEADLPAGANEAADLAALRSDSRVEAADETHIYSEPQDEMNAAEPVDAAVNPSEADSAKWKPNDPRYNEQWNFSMIHAEDAWQVTRGKGAIVAVIDTGVAFKNTDKGNIARDFGNTQFVPGYDFVNRDDSPNDDQGHGTHVAGTIAESTDNGEGVAGLAFEAKIMPIKVLNSEGSGSTANIAEGIRWAADHGANVINMSLGGPFPDNLMRSACAYAHKKGVTIVCAAGNSGREGVGYPAAYKDCIAVSAVGPTGDLSYYSTWGKEVAIAAPGGDKEKGGDAGGILQNTVYPVNGTLTDGYYAFQGTSMATPHVAAVAALIVSEGVKNPDDVKNILLKSAQKKGPKKKFGAGILDAGKASKLASNLGSDSNTRLWIVFALFGGCYLIGRSRQKSGTRGGYPVLGALAIAFGLLFPDWLTNFVGQSSHWNLIGHSILIPAALMVMGADKTEKRMLGWAGFAMAAHLGWEFLRGTTPVGAEVGNLQLLPWVAANVLIGCGMLIAGLRERTE